ncbi:MAG: efflux RND transporter periplasmic adaptor subunit [Zoogloeaceae bacterium]|jgi:HlyD family secretion protein|nr:efflux RND transporter periplasmic adaptor subunit [Zoogloeaceae bacterium]
MKKIPFKPLALSLALCVLTVSAYVWFTHDGRMPEERYKFAELTPGEIRQTVSANGTLNPVTLVNVGTQVSGSVKALYVDFNDQVKEGQVLAELDDAMLAAQSRQSKANLMSANATLDLAVANADRMRTLFAQEYVSKQEVDQSAQALKSAQAQVRQAQAQADKDEANLGYTIIRSPVSGVVVDRQVDVGQTVAASFQTPTLFKIAQDLAQMQIDSAFAEADVGNIKVGQQVMFTVDAFPDRNFRGKVRQVRLNPTTTSNVVTYNVVVAVDNPDQILLPGMTAYVNITVAQSDNALLLPNAALRFRPSAEETVPAEKPKSAPGGVLGGMTGMGGPGMGGPRRNSNGQARQGGASERLSKGTVYVLREGTPTALIVNLGITDNRNTEIIGDELKAGDKVIVGIAEAGASASSGESLRVRAF